MDGAGKLPVAPEDALKLVAVEAQNAVGQCFQHAWNAQIWRRVNDWLCDRATDQAPSSAGPP